MPLTSQEKRAARARHNYGPNALGNLVRKQAYRNCDYTDEGQLRQFSDEASLLKFEEDKYSRGGRREPYSTQAKETVPQEQLALEYVAAMEAMSTVAQMEGHQTRVHQEYVAESLQHRHDEHDEKLDRLVSIAESQTSEQLKLEQKKLEIITAKAKAKATKEEKERKARDNARDNAISATQSIIAQLAATQFDSSSSPQENRAALASRHKEERQMLQRCVAEQRRVQKRCLASEDKDEKQSMQQEFKKKRVNEAKPSGIGAQASDAADFVIAIPSYNRADQLFKKTYERILLPMGLTSKALVFLQTDEDVRTYHEKFAGTGMGFARAPKKGFAQVNHFIEHYFDIGAKVVVMHDDLRSILKLTTDKSKFQPLTEPSQVVEMFNLAFHSMQSNGLTLGGVLQTTNPSWAPDKEVGLDLKFIYDPLHFIISTKEAPLCRHFHFDDLERTIYAYKRDGGVVRLNRYAIDTPSEAYDPKAVGGLAGQRKFEEAQAAALVFEEEFKEFVGKFKRLKNGLAPRVKKLPFKPERNLAMVQ